MTDMIPWEILRTEPAYRGRRKIDKVWFRMPSGQEADYEIKQEGAPVCVLALTTEQNVVLARQFRPGPNRVLLELPGGGSDPGEEFVDAMRRELLEETGYAGEVQFVGTSLADAYSTCLRRNFVATGCRKVQEPANDPNEPIEVVEMPLPAFREHLRTGELTDVATAYLGLDFLGLL